MSNINEIHPPIKFDFNYSKTQIHFLDITITKTSTRKLLTTPYKKEIDRQSYLNRNQNTLKLLNEASPIYKQRLKIICTAEEDFTE